MKKNVVTILVMLIGGCISLHAQEYKTTQSISDQLKNNNTPGARYAPASQASPAKSKGFTGSSLAKQIQEGKLGMPVSTASAPAAKATPAVKPAGVTLSSEASAEQMKAEAQKQAEATKTQPVVVPTQEEKPKETAAPKTEQ